MSKARFNLAQAKRNRTKATFIFFFSILILIFSSPSSSPSFPSCCSLTFLFDSHLPVIHLPSHSLKRPFTIPWQKPIWNKSARILCGREISEATKSDSASIDAATEAQERKSRGRKEKRKREREKMKGFPLSEAGTHNASVDSSEPQVQELHPPPLESLTLADQLTLLGVTLVTSLATRVDFFFHGCFLFWCYKQ